MRDSRFLGTADDGFTGRLRPRTTKVRGRKCSPGLILAAEPTQTERKATTAL